MKVYNNKRSFIHDTVQTSDRVLDVGFWGQATQPNSEIWPHGMILERAHEVYGVDISFDESRLEHPDRYQRIGADEFRFDKKFDVIFASELIEHLSNPGSFLERCLEHIEENGCLILTTPNAFSFMTIVQKFLKEEPPVNKDHTVYFNHVVLSQLLEKNGWQLQSYSYIADFPSPIGVKRVILRMIYHLIAQFTPKFLETLVIIAVPKK